MSRESLFSGTLGTTPVQPSEYPGFRYRFFAPGGITALGQLKASYEISGAREAYCRSAVLVVLRDQSADDAETYLTRL